MPTNRMLSDLLDAIATRGRAFVERAGKSGAAHADGGVAELLERLLSGRGEASGLATAGVVLDHWRSAGPAAREAFLVLLGERFGTDEARLNAAIEAYRRQPTAENAAAIHHAAEPRRQEIIRRLNMVTGAMEVLLEMRAATLALMRKIPALALVDADFVHLLSSWFNRGFLVLRPIDWSTSASILERIIRYEAVHAIRSWEDLRLRLAPSDRRCFAFFHPRLPDEPLIFVEVALTRAIPVRIEEVLASDRAIIPAGEATTAVFYSISNTQVGLRGVSFGNFLLKQVIETLGEELPNIDTFMTLSPVPGFAAWLAKEPPSPATTTLMTLLARPGWADDSEVSAEIEGPLVAEAARYLLRATGGDGTALDQVARFHLGNGARLERINFLADRSPKGMQESWGVMVNYRYELGDIEKNHELFTGAGTVVAARDVEKLLHVAGPGRSRAVRRVAHSTSSSGFHR